MKEKIVEVSSADLVAALHNAFQTGFICGLMSGDEDFEPPKKKPPLVEKDKQADSEELREWVIRAHSSIAGLRRRRNGTVKIPDLFF